MRHGVAFRKLNRDGEHRRALLRNLVTSLVLYDRVTTTLPKAKEARRLADKMVTLAKRGDDHARIQAAAYLFQPTITVPKLFSQVAARYADRPGGYTRIIRIGNAVHDKSSQAVLEYVDAPGDLKIATAKRNLPNLNGKIQSKRAQLDKVQQRLNQSELQEQGSQQERMFSSQQLYSLTKTLRGMERQKMKLDKALAMPFLRPGHRELKYPLRSEEIRVDKVVSVQPVLEKYTKLQSVDRFGKNRHVVKVKRRVSIAKALPKRAYRKMGNQHLAV